MTEKEKELADNIVIPRMMEVLNKLTGEMFTYVIAKLAGKILEKPVLPHAPKGADIGRYRWGILQEERLVAVFGKGVFGDMISTAYDAVKDHLGVNKQEIVDLSGNPHGKPNRIIDPTKPEGNG